ncbi:TM2 domain-containing protein [Plastorhodobacter daqingensis]|uniref:TM2 domain-containing protein n=1 Tax=Plastorhodobacter daqingensis TaxID=1387281 RepID=A0ABW2UQ21_9RHOB
MSPSVNERMLIEQRVSNEMKSPVVAYLLWFFTGGLGGHRFYLGRTGSGLAMLGLTLVGLLASAILIGFIPLAIVGIWLLVDAFLIPKMLQEGRSALREKLILEFRTPAR